MSTPVAFKLPWGADRVRFPAFPVEIIAGKGSPSGNVSAPVGTLYIQTDGSTDTAHWRKESGTGTSGWVASQSTALTPASVAATGQVSGALVDAADTVAHNTLGAAGALTLTAGKGYFPVIGSAGTARTGCTIPNGSVSGQIIVLEGTDNTATVSFTVNGASNIAAPSQLSSRTLGLCDQWILVWDAITGKWVEAHYQGNSSMNVAQKIAKVALAASDAAAGVFSWANPETGAVIVNKIILDVTTKASAACTLDVGFAATSIKDDRLIDGVDVGTAAGTFSTIDQAGANGKERCKVASGGFVTASMDTGATAGLVGSAYIYYTPA